VFSATQNTFVRNAFWRVFMKTYHEARIQMYLWHCLHRGVAYHVLGFVSENYSRSMYKWMPCWDYLQRYMEVRCVWADIPDTWDSNVRFCTEVYFITVANKKVANAQSHALQKKCNVLVSVDFGLTSGTPKFRGFKPGRERWIFKDDKIRSTTSFGG
jgi:hypothetical protein